MKGMYSVAIIGAGPSGLTAAIYLSRAGHKTIVLESQLIGGQVATIDRVDNYPGFDTGIAGVDLASSLESQARRFGAEIKFAKVNSIKPGRPIILQTDAGEVMATAVLIASGAGYRHLGIPGEAEYSSHGVHYCATCDGAFYRDKDIVVVGGANTAVQEVIFLAKQVKHIVMLVRSRLRADKILREELTKLTKADKVIVLEGWRPLEMVGDGDKLTGVKVTDGQKERQLNCDGAFVFVGTEPNNGFIKGTKIRLDEAGRIVTGDNLMTDEPNIWACGDIRSGEIRQIVSAAGDGAVAAKHIDLHLFWTTVRWQNTK